MSNLPQTLTSQSANLFKGIALFTPGGDLVYCVDPLKQNRWHLQLCAFLQELLGLSAPPHFLVPCFTATIDRWQDPRTQIVQTFAEIYPFACRYQALLNAVFGCSGQEWGMADDQLELCDPLVLMSYRQQFPALWQSHDLVARWEPIEPATSGRTTLPLLSTSQTQQMQGYVLRLFVSGNNALTERILKHLHRLLEENLQQPYTLKVIDVRKHPEQAEADQITATPTLVKVWPEPMRRVAGDLSNLEALVQVLR